ncbi:MAG: transketolase [Proteobacteria bacterium]|nr:transketolase [Desulfobacula sp.]MBU3952027.1 transketolase [Pseudomonadota bacterium]MBU4130431.1 transketolase [Pseudomonadota bacterium]
MKNSALIFHNRSMAEVLDPRSIELRKKIITALEHGRRGHIGASFSLVEILRVLYDKILKFDAVAPSWPGRDRCILSKGHGCLALYVLLAEKGFFPEEALYHFCQDGALLGGHPDATKIPGVEASTGSLGHGLSIGVGMAVNAGYEKSGARVFVIAGDGECNEGSLWEAAMGAGKYGLDNLTVLVDYNKYQSYDTTSYVQELEPFADKWRSFGFGVIEINGHDVTELTDVLKHLPLKKGKPSAIICHTIKGKGVGFAENNLAWHHKSKIDSEMITQLMDALG